MTAKNFAIVGLRLLAVYCFIGAVQMFTVYGPLSFVNAVANPQMFGHQHAEALVVTSIPGGTLLLFSIFLYAFSLPLAHRLAPPDSSESKELVCSFEQFQALLFSVAGILIMAMALPVWDARCRNWLPPIIPMRRVSISCHITVGFISAELLFR